MRKNRKTTEEKRKIGKGDQRLCLQWKRKSVFHSFFKEDIFGRREFICFVLHGCSILIDRKQWHKFVLMIYIIVWVGVCVIPACCFFYECLNERTSAYIFWQNIDCLYFFHQHTSCLLRLPCHLDWQRLTIFLLFISLSVSLIVSPRLLGTIEKFIL